MKVLVVTNMYPNDASPSFGIFVKDQVEALRRVEGVDLTVWHFKPGGLRYLSAVRALRAFCKGKDFDLIHAHYGLAGWVALAAPKSVKVVTFHGTDLRHPVVGRLSRALTRLTDVTAVASPTLRRRLRAKRKVLVLPTGVDLERFRPIKHDKARQKLGLDPKGSYVLFAADPGRKVKRFDRAQALVKELPQVELLTLENVPPEEVPLWINAANAVLVTSEEEGFGLAICEALACNRPVLSTPVGIAPLALDGLANCLCAQFDLQLWGEKLEALAEREIEVAGGRQRAAVFSTERMAQRVARASNMDVI